MNHTHYTHAHLEDIQTRLVVSLITTVLVLFVYHFPFFDAPTRFMILTFMYMYGGRPFLKGMYQELQAKRPGMMTLLGTALTVAYIYSTAVLLGLPGMLFIVELATLIDIMLLGHWIEMRVVLGASEPVFTSLKIDTKGFKFDREEANKR